MCLLLGRPADRWMLALCCRMELWKPAASTARPKLIWSTASMVYGEGLCPAAEQGSAIRPTILSPRGGCVGAPSHNSSTSLINHCHNNILMKTNRYWLWSRSHRGARGSLQSPGSVRFPASVPTRLSRRGVSHATPKNCQMGLPWSDVQEMCSQRYWETLEQTKAFQESYFLSRKLIIIKLHNRNYPTTPKHHAAILSSGLQQISIFVRVLSV